MKTFELYYLNYEGDTKTREVTFEEDVDIGEALRELILEDQGDGDGIRIVLSFQEIN